MYDDMKIFPYQLVFDKSNTEEPIPVTLVIHQSTYEMFIRQLYRTQMENITIKEFRNICYVQLGMDDWTKAFMHRNKITIMSVDNKHILGG